MESLNRCLVGILMLHGPPPGSCSSAADISKPRWKKAFLISPQAAVPMQFPVCISTYRQPEAEGRSPTTGFQGFSFLIFTSSLFWVSHWHCMPPLQQLISPSIVDPVEDVTFHLQLRYDALMTTHYSVYPENWGGTFFQHFKTAEGSYLPLLLNAKEVLPQKHWKVPSY